MIEVLSVRTLGTEHDRSVTCHLELHDRVGLSLLGFRTRPRCHAAAARVMQLSRTASRLPDVATAHRAAVPHSYHPIRQEFSHGSSFVAARSLVASLAGCASMQPKNVPEVIAADPELSTLSKLISDAGLTQTLSAPGPFTVFAPTNAAFKAVPAKTMDELAKNKDLLAQVLTYHVVPGKAMAADVKQGNAKSVNGGANLAVSKAGTYVTVEDAVVTKGGPWRQQWCGSRGRPRSAAAEALACR